MSYEAKENYVTRNPEPEAWRNHANGKIISLYSKFVRGVCGDLGCNHGACTLLLLDFADRVEEIHGFDMNAKALEVARKTACNMQEQPPVIPVSFEVQNLLNLQVENNKFDFLMSFHTLEHIFPQDVDAFVSEIHRVLKPGGTLLMSIPYNRAYPDPAHVGFYKEDDFCRIFERHGGFQIVECMRDNRWNEKELLTAVLTKS
jgi:ubiquinone/menaquinone biosynthesis C-methylase UbiE